MTTLEISDDKKIKEIKEEFNNKFPHLKIEFFSEEHQEGEASNNSGLLDEELYLKDIRKNHTNGTLSINGHLKTSTLASNFHDHFGVNIQVYRKSGKLWLQTASTDDWTLSHQEQKGEEYDR